MTAAPEVETPAPDKPIGGFFGLEPTRAGARAAAFGQGHRLDFWNARAALTHLLSIERIRRVWLPAYICRAVAEAADREGREVLFYRTGPQLAPDGEDLAQGLKAGDAVVGVDYFGARAVTLPDLASRFDEVLWVQDRAQALWPDPAPWGDGVLYSPRKVAGAADGGVLLSRELLATPAWRPDDELRLAPARMRAEDPLGLRNATWFPAYQAAEAAMSCEPRPMSALSREVLEGLDVAAMAQRRRRNAEALLARIGDAALLGDDRLLDGGPFGVPVLTADAATVASRMAERRVFCARHWADLPSPPEAFPAEHELSRRLLTLPCDHRYDAADMARVAETFLACR